MRKIFIIFVLLFLVGCTNNLPNFDSEVSITLNINSEVDPVITPSRGEGTYDSINKTYKITVSNSAPIDISLSYDNYQTVTISFSTSELLQGDIVKDVDFGSLPTAKVVLNVVTEANSSEIIIEDYEYSRNANTFTIILPNRNEGAMIKMSAPGYQEIEIPIKPEDLVIGYFSQLVVLPKEDEAVITVKNYKGMNFNLLDLYSNKLIDYYPGREFNYYVVNKGDEVFYEDLLLGKTVYLKVEDNVELLPFGFVGEEFYTIKDDSYIRDGRLYYEYNNKRYLANLSYDDGKIKTNIPIGSKILISLNDKYAYKKTIDNKELISLSKNDFYELSPLNVNVKIYDLYNQEFIDSFVSYDNIYLANDKVFNFTESFPYPSNYYLEYQDFLLQDFIDGEWITVINAYPAAEGIIFRCLDSDMLPIMNGELDYFINKFPPYNGFFVNLSASIPYKNRELSLSHYNYLSNLDYQEIEGKYYYVLEKPIEINTNLYEMSFFIESNQDFLEISIEIGDTVYNHFMPIIFSEFIDISLVDRVTITISYYDDGKNRYSYISVIQLTEDILNRGFVKLNDHAEVQEINYFTYSLGQNVELEKIELNHSHFYIEGNKVYYLYEPTSIIVQFTKDEIPSFKIIPFKIDTNNYIIG